MAKLTGKRSEFVIQYPCDFNATQAAIRSGYSPKTARSQGQRLLTDVDIQAALAVAQTKREEETGISAAWVLKSLESVVNRCMQEEAVYDKDGEPTGEYQFQHSGANKALELIGKHLKMFTDIVKVATDSPLLVLLQRIDGKGLPKPE